MDITYSTYEAKAKFSEVLRHVREGRTVTVSYRGEPVAEIRPIQRGPTNTEERIQDLQRRGIIVPSGIVPSSVDGVIPDMEARRPGALDRFLADRDE